MVESVPIQPTPPMYRVYPPTVVTHAVDVLRAQCSAWQPTPSQPKVPGMPASTIEATLCDQVTGSRDVAGDASTFGIIEGVAFAFVIILIYRILNEALDGVVVGIKLLLSRISARRRSRDGPIGMI